MTRTPRPHCSWCGRFVPAGTPLTPYRLTGFGQWWVRLLCARCQTEAMRSWGEQPPDRSTDT